MGRQREIENCKSGRDPCSRGFQPYRTTLTSDIKQTDHHSYAEGRYGQAVAIHDVDQPQRLEFKKPLRSGAAD